MARRLFRASGRLAAPPTLQLQDFASGLAQLEESYLQYVGQWRALQLADPVVGQRLVKALTMRLRQVFDDAGNDLDWWSKSAMAALDAQCQERKRSFVRSMDATDRIQQATTGLLDRLAELKVAEQQLGAMEQRLAQWTRQPLVPAARPQEGGAASQPSEPACV